MFGLRMKVSYYLVMNKIVKVAPTLHCVEMDETRICVI